MWALGRPRSGIQPFYLYRIVDASGVSGTGIVAVGVVLPSGKAVLEWCSRWKTVTVFESVAQVERIHGHGGRTLLHWGIPPQPPRGLRIWAVWRRWFRLARPIDPARILRALPALPAATRDLT